MFTKTLSKETAKALELLGESSLLNQAYLAGGTACALQIGHRISIDLDFFTPEKFDTKKMIRSLQGIGRFELNQESSGTVLGQMEGVKFSLFVYEYPLLFPQSSFQNIQLADLRDIGAMKLDAISSRGLRRDFIDLFFIMQQGISLQEIFSFYDRKYSVHSSNRMHLLKSLVYFKDAEQGPMPRMLVPMDWKKIRGFFEGQVKILAPS